MLRSPESHVSHARLFAGILALAAFLPLLVLYARDQAYSYFGWVNTETPQGSIFAWEVWLIAGVCWLSALAVLIVSSRETRITQGTRQ